MKLSDVDKSPVWLFGKTWGFYRLIRKTMMFCLTEKGHSLTCSEAELRQLKDDLVELFSEEEAK